MSTRTAKRVQKYGANRASEDRNQKQEQKRQRGQHRTHRHTRRGVKVERLAAGWLAVVCVGGGVLDARARIGNRKE